jgi:aconitate decarboxylase
MPTTPDELGSRTRSVETSLAIVDFVLDTTFEDLTPDALKYLKIFLMDTLAVGVAGGCSAGSDIALKSVKSWGQGDQARLIGRPGMRLPAPSAAFVNGYNIHALEWDGLHEYSVVICLCAPLAAMMAEAEQNPVSGKEFLTAFCLAVEVAVTLGGASLTAPRFFRPAVSGMMGAAMGVAKMRGYSREQTLQMLGLTYSQASGTMQAHWEGAMMLAMQIGVSARAVICAADMAAAGAKAPVDVLLGKFGFFTLFETADNIDKPLAAMGGKGANVWKITDVAHKPYPAGRATQSVLTMFNELTAKHDIAPEQIEEIIVAVPPLIMLLVGRPLTDSMTSSYARLCLKFVGPMMLLRGEIDPRLFPEDSAPPDDVKALGERFTIVLNDITDPNALGPQSCTIRLKSGEEFHANCDVPYGSPGNRMPKDAREQKIRKCFEVGGYRADPQILIDLIETIEDLDDVRALFSAVCD